MLNLATSRLVFGALLSLPLALVACGDDTSTGGNGGGGSPSTGGGGEASGGSPTTGGNGGESAGGGGESAGGGGENAGGGGGNGGEGGEGGGEPFEAPTPFAVPLSAAGPDQLQSVTAAAPGFFLAAGFASATVGGPRAVTVVKFSAAGPDITFGTNGVATTTTLFVGGNDEIDIATQSDGKIIVSATIASALVGDRDIAVLRLNADGSPDTNFGLAGVRIINLNDAINAPLVGLDSARSLTVNAANEIFVHAASRAVGNATGGGPRLDTDFTVVKLTAAGAVDTSFGDEGEVRVDLGERNATPRGIKVLADGSLLAGGYAVNPDFGPDPQPFLYKLTAGGDLDGTFATDGIFHEAVLATQTEIYNFAVHGGDIVTAGYGRSTGDTNDYVSLRFDIDTGVRDITWGGAVNGAVVVDPSGAMLGSNARNAVGLPGGETIILGSTGPSNLPAQDAVFVVLDADGALDTKYGDGIHTFQLGANGNDQFWGGAVSGTMVALVGYKGGGAAPQTDVMNDDAYGVLFEMQ